MLPPRPETVSPVSAHMCPACSEPLVDAAIACGECGHRLAVPAAVQQDDRTPYGHSAYFGPGVFLTTCWWVAAASAHRLTYLALLGRSHASRRFVFWVVAWLALSAAVLQLGHVGWRIVRQEGIRTRPAASKPVGRGWYRLAGDAAQPVIGRRGDLAEVWWNPTQAVIAAAHAFVLTILVSWSILVWQRRGVRRELAPPYRDQGRLEAAMQYGTAWLMLLLPASLLASGASLLDVASAARWFSAPRGMVYGPAATLALIAVCGYSFGLIRAGATMPFATRSRVSLFFGLWNPAIIALAVIAVSLGLRLWMRVLAGRLGLPW